MWIFSGSVYVILFVLCTTHGHGWLRRQRRLIIHYISARYAQRRGNQWTYIYLIYPLEHQRGVLHVFIISQIALMLTPPPFRDHFSGVPGLVNKDVDPTHLDRHTYQLKSRLEGLRWCSSWWRNNESFFWFDKPFGIRWEKNFKKWIVLTNATGVKWNKEARNTKDGLEEDRNGHCLWRYQREHASSYILLLHWNEIFDTMTLNYDLDLHSLIIP